MTVWVVVLTPPASVSKVEVTVLAVSRTVSMVCLTVRVPSAATSVMVLMSFSTPPTIWREVSVMTCFCWVLPLESVSVMFSVVRVILPSISVVVSEMDLTTDAVTALVLALAFLPEVLTADAALPADWEMVDAAFWLSAAAAFASFWRSVQLLLLMPLPASAS